MQQMYTHKRMAYAQADLSLHYSHTVSFVVDDTDQKPESSFIGKAGQAKGLLHGMGN